MATKLIELTDGILIEVEAEAGEARRISGGFAEKVGASLNNIQPLLIAISHSLGETWQQINENLDLEKATVEIGLGFEGEGNVFITKAKASANLTVTLELKPKKAKSGA